MIKALSGVILISYAQLRPTLKDPIQVLVGPVTRAQVNKFNEVLNELV